MDHTSCITLLRIGNRSGILSHGDGFKTLSPFPHIYTSKSFTDYRNRFYLFARDCKTYKTAAKTCFPTSHLTSVFHLARNATFIICHYLPSVSSLLVMAWSLSFRTMITDALIETDQTNSVSQQYTQFHTFNKVTYFYLDLQV